jgi:hypothetical protein
VELQEETVKYAIDADFRQACEILGYDPEEAQNDPDLFAEIAFFLMTSEVLS